MKNLNVTSRWFYTVVMILIHLPLSPARVGSQKSTLHLFIGMVFILTFRTARQQYTLKFLAWHYGQTVVFFRTHRWSWSLLTTMDFWVSLLTSWKHHFPYQSMHQTTHLTLTLGKVRLLLWYLFLPNCVMLFIFLYFKTNKKYQYTWFLRTDDSEGNDFALFSCSFQLWL